MARSYIQTAHKTSGKIAQRLSELVNENTAKPPKRTPVGVGTPKWLWKKKTEMLYVNAQC